MTTNFCKKWQKSYEIQTKWKFVPVKIFFTSSAIHLGSANSRKLSYVWANLIYLSMTHFTKMARAWFLRKKAVDTAGKSQIISPYHLFGVRKLWQVTCKGDAICIGKSLLKGALILIRLYVCPLTIISSTMMTLLYS